MTEPEVGQVWRSKRNRRRTVTLTSRYEESGDFGVRRNTSRRTQSISAATLRKDYRLDDTATPGGRS